MVKDIELAIVFADVVGSTRLFDNLGDQRARAISGDFDLQMLGLP